MAARDFGSIEHLGKQSVLHSIQLYLAATACILTFCAIKKNNAIVKKSLTDLVEIYISINLKKTTIFPKQSNCTFQKIKQIVCVNLPKH